MSTQFIITNAGKAAIINAQNTGTSPVVISSVGFGSTSWNPTATAVSLQSEVKRITAIGGDVVSEDTIHVTVQDSTTDSYVIREIGVFLDSGVLFAVASDPVEFLDKRPAISVNLAVDIIVTNLPAGSVTVGGISISNPPASNTIAGVIMTASDSETVDGLSSTKAVTPLGLLARTATLIRSGLVRLATGPETSSGTSDSLAVTPLGLLSRTASTIRSGLTRLATSAETIAGSLSDVAVTPAGLSARVASTSTQGVISIADQSETNTGSNSTKAIVPSTLRGSIGYADAWVVFNGAATVPVIIGTAHNVSSITDRGVGQYTVNFTSAMPNASYCWAGSVKDTNNSANAPVLYAANASPKTASGIGVDVQLDGAAFADMAEVSVIVFAQ